MKGVKVDEEKLEAVSDSAGGGCELAAVKHCKCGWG